MSEIQAPPRWVTDRATCSARGVFEELAKLVRRDINEMNESTSGNQRFVFTREAPGGCPIIYVTREEQVPGPSRHLLCGIVCNDGPLNYVVIRHKNGERLKIEPSWSREHGHCRLSIQYHDDKECSISRDDLWKVVQEFLEPLFFSERRKADLSLL